MPSSRRRQRRSTPSEDSLALLSTLPDRLSTPIRYAQPFPRLPRRRHLLVRGDFLLLLTRPPQHHAPLTPATVQLVTQLPTLNSITLQNNTIVLPSARLIFPSPNLASQFYAILPLEQKTYALPANISNYPFLGRGATSVVRALSPQLAVKLVSKSRVLDPSHLHQLIAERDALIALSHTPFTIRLLSACQTPSHFAFVTSRAHYGALSDIFKQLPQRRMPPDIARALFAEIVLALREVHLHGFLYRDMKMANVLVGRDGHVMLADFGLVKAVDTSDTGSVSEVSTTVDDSGEDDDDDIVGTATSFVGTTKYMAPEVKGRLGHPRRYGGSADVWALGVLLYILLTGEYPSANRELRFPEDVPQQARDVVQGLLQRDVDKRMALSDVQKCEWLSGIQWRRLREEGLRGDVSEQVVRFFDENGVVGKVESARSAQIAGTTAGSDLGSIVTEATAATAEEVEDEELLAAGAGFQLFGFDYVSRTLELQGMT